MPKIRSTVNEPVTDFFDMVIPRDLPSASTYSAYASASDVAIICRNLLGPDENFSTSSSPSMTAVNTWLSSGCSIIETRLASDGWTVPISSSTTLYNWIRDLNALYAAARAEISRINITLAPGERTRGQIFEKMFWDQLNNICDADLTTVGAVRSTTGIHGATLYVGGTSVAEKETHDDNSDRVTPRFKKGLFDMPGTL